MSTKPEKEIKYVLNHPDLSDDQRDVLKRFDRENKVNGLALTTRANYLMGIKDFAIKVGKPFKDVEKPDVMDYFDMLEVSPSTMQVYKVYIKRFFQWLHGCDRREYPDCVKWVKSTPNHIQKLPQHIPTPEEVKAMVGSADNLRDPALVITHYESACRPSETLGVNIEDVTFDQYGCVIMVHGKTGDRRIRLFDAAPYLAQWINHHPRKDDIKAPLFPTFGRGGYGARLGYSGFRQILLTLGKRAKIKKDVNPHIFRHSRLTELAKELQESELKVIAGWTGDSKMPKIYVHLSGADLDKKMLENRGLLPKEERKKKSDLAPRPCPRCEMENPATAKFCNKCSAVLDLKTAMELEKRMDVTDDKIVKLLQDEEVQALMAKKMAELGLAST